MANIPFGERVRRPRIRNSMSQVELAGKIGVTQAAISNCEQGKSSPGNEHKVRLKKILGDVWTKANTNQTEVTAVPSPIGSWLTHARIRQNMSVPELAEKAGISAMAVYNIEGGRISNPRQETIRKLEAALKTSVPLEAKEESREEARIEGVGELIGFDPHNDDDLPTAPGVYVLYDISERSIYVGQSGDIRKRIRDHRDKFWFKSPIVETGAYVKIDDKAMREKIERLLVRFLKSNAVINTQNVDR